MSEPQNREEAIFEAVRQFASAAERAAYLEGACAGDAVLRQRMENLLKADAQTANALDRPPVPDSKTIPISTVPVPVAERVGDRIGHYKLLQQIGEGGCGVVYLAEQDKPVRRRVALKVIKPGMDTKQVLARFEAERQALALMDHPNIAKVFDGGATGNGRPFFVMELVKGVRITEYCDQNKLSTEARLALFGQVCQAVQHAHQKGIIHRDIKPSNILVADHDGVAVPKVIDFGIAKATTDQPLTDRTLFTALEQFIGTPAYMSPEQAKMSGLDIDTRTDIYSLGVLLYELLTGKTPFDSQRLVAAGFDEIRRIIREEEPPRPSTRVTQELVAASRLVAPKSRAGGPSAADSKNDNSGAPHPQSRVRYDHTEALVRFLKGDLDWIVMKALEKDRTRRYETASGLAADIQRHLNNEAVLARPPSNVYRFQKMVSRNKLAVGATAAVILALIAGLVASLVFYDREAVEHRGAVVAKEQATENFKNAQQAVDDIVRMAETAGTQPEDRRADKPKDLKLALADSAVANYQAFYRQDTNEPALQDNLAQLYQAQAGIYRRQYDDRSQDLSRMTDPAERDKTRAEVEGLAQVVTNALQSSCRLLEDLSSRFPAQSQYREHLAAGYSSLAQSLPDTGAVSALKKALSLRNGLLEERPDDLNELRAKADLLARLVASQTNEEEIQINTETELSLREKIKQLPNPDRASQRDDLIKLADVYGRASDLPGDKAKSIADLRNANLAVEALLVDADTNTRETNLMEMLSLAQSQVKLARRLKESGSPADAIPWAQKNVETLEFLNAHAKTVNGVSDQYFVAGNLAEGYVDLADTLAAAGSKAAARAAYQRAIDSMAAICRNNRQFYSMAADSGAFKMNDAGLELDAMWNKRVTGSLADQNPAEAIAAAAKAAEFWRERDQESPGNWDDLVAASELRLHNLCELAGRATDASNSLAEANSAQKFWAERSPSHFVKLAEALAVCQPPADDTNPAAATLRTACQTEAVAALRQAEAQTNYSFPKAEFAGDKLKVWESSPSFREIETAWRQRERAPTAGTNEAVVSVADNAAIQSAHDDERQITLKGQIASAQWSANGKVFLVTFNGVGFRDFMAVVRQVNRIPIEAKLGGDLATILKPGGTIELKGTPSIFAGHLQLDIQQTEQLIGYARPNLISTNLLASNDSDVPKTAGRLEVDPARTNAAGQTIGDGAQVPPPGIISPADTDRLLAATNEEVQVAGKIVRAEWSSYKTVIYIEFEEAPVDGFVAVIFKRDAPAFAKALGGDPAAVLTGRPVKIRGATELYKGRVEMVLSHPDQISFDDNQTGANGLGTSVGGP